MQINQTEVLALADAKILELANKIASKINPQCYPEDIFIGAKIVALRKAILSSTSLLDTTQKETILIGIQELSI